MSKILVAVLLVCSYVQAEFPAYEGRATYPNEIHFLPMADGTGGPSEERRANGAATEHISHFRSQAMPLGFGEVVFTDPSTTILPMPPGKLTITGFHAEVVDENNVSVPLSEAYLHHWLVFGPANKGVCGGYLSYSFGVGAESRGSPVRYPVGYGLVVNGTEVWGANIHILRTVNLDPKYGVKGCIECLYAPGKGCPPDQTGQFSCCADGSFCPTSNSSAASPRQRGFELGSSPRVKNYYLKYSVWWQESSDPVTPVDIFVLDASNCQIEYNVYPSATGLSTTTLNYTVPFDGGVVFAAGHQHIGSYNITLFIGPPGSEKVLCRSIPVYGTQDGVPGDEKGYVVAIPPCQFDEPYPVSQGDHLRLVSLYNVGASDPRTWNVGMHGGVMSLFYLAAVRK